MRNLNLQKINLEAIPSEFLEFHYGLITRSSIEVQGHIVLLLDDRLSPPSVDDCVMMMEDSEEESGRSFWSISPSNCD